MNGSKISRALSNRVRGYDELRGEDITLTSKRVPVYGTFHKPGSCNPRKGYAAPKGERSKRHVAPAGGSIPSRTQRRQGTKSRDVARIRGLTRGARNRAARAIGRQVGTGDVF